MDTGKKYNIKSVKLICWGGKNFTHPINTGGFSLQWECKGIGFGELSFIQDKNRGLICETEGMDRYFIDAVLKYFLDNCVDFTEKRAYLEQDEA